MIGQRTDAEHAMYIGGNRKAAVELLEAAGWDYGLMKRALSAAERDAKTGEIRFADALNAVRALRAQLAPTHGAVSEARPAQ